MEIDPVAETCFVSVSKSSRPAMEPNYPLILWLPEVLSPKIKRPGPYDNHSPTSSAEIKNCGAVRLRRLHALMAGTGTNFRPWSKSKKRVIYNAQKSLKLRFQMFAHFSSILVQHLFWCPYAVHLLLRAISNFSFVFYANDWRPFLQTYGFSRSYAGNWTKWRG